MPFTIARPEVPLALLRRLGEPPFWPRDGQTPGFLAAMEPIYEAVTAAALELAFGEE
jgi:hypothetical protein